jgi:malate synthase
MAGTITIDGLTIDKDLYDFITDEAMPGTGIKPVEFWPAFSKIVHDLAPTNRELLQKRDAIQEKLDAWYRDHREAGYEMPEYKAFLEEIGYLVPEGRGFFGDDRECRPGNRRGRRAAAGRADHERPFRAERRECPLGFAL